MPRRSSGPGDAGTSFNDPDNWREPPDDPPTAPPGAGDTATFGAGAANSVVGFPSSVTNAATTVSGTYTFSLNTNTYVTEPTVNAGILTLQNGTLNSNITRLDGTGQLVVSSDATLEALVSLQVNAAVRLDVNGGTVSAAKRRNTDHRVIPQQRRDGEPE